jgi:hypothetical protein
MLAVALSRWPWTECIDESALRSFTATFAASPEVFRPSASTMNSSPPKRERVSSERTASWSRAATDLSTSSPTSWPRESLMFLKRSTSRQKIAMRSFARWARWIACSTRSVNNVRLGNPVSASRVERNTSCSSLGLVSVMSLPTPR